MKTSPRRVVAVAAIALALTVPQAPASAAAAAVSKDGLYQLVSGSRVGDTRTGAGFGRKRLAAGQTAWVPVLNRGGVPASGVSAVTVTVTAINSGASGFVTAYASGRARPNTSVLNYPAGWTGATTVSLPVGADGKIALYAGNAAVDLAVDVIGWYATGSSTAATGSVFWPSDVVRAFDSRQGGEMLRPGEEIELSFEYDTSAGDIPSAIMLNLTALGGTGNGYFTALSAAGTVPATSSLNFAKGEVAPNLTIVPLRRISTNEFSYTIRNTSYVSAHLLIDEVGTFFRDPAAMGFKRTSLTPTRIVDTRVGTGTLKAMLGPAETRIVNRFPAGMVTPATLGVEGTLLGVSPTAGTWLTEWDGATAAPTASNLNLAKGVNRANGVMTVLGGDSSSDAFFAVRNQYGSVHIVQDVTGRWDATPELLADSSGGGGQQRPESMRKPSSADRSVTVVRN